MSGLQVMEITPKQRHLVRRSFGQLATQQDEVARLFYDKLFELAPETRSMFKDMRAQRHQLMRYLALLVVSLDNPNSFLDLAQDLGKRHARYGVRKEHYVVFGKALLWAFEQSLGTAFTPKIKQAWVVVYNHIARYAIDAATI